MRLPWTLAAAVLPGLLMVVGAQAPAPLEIPDNAVLEGLPTEREVSSPDGTARAPLSEEEAAAARLRIAVEDGRLSWTSRDGEALELFRTGGFTYLTSSRTPGQYVRITRLDDRMAYVEHFDTDTGHVIYRGELRITLGQ